jgi:signal peptidase I
MGKKIKQAPTAAKQNYARPEPPTTGGGILTWLFGPASKDNAIEWVKILLFAGAVALLIRWSFLEPFKIPSGSMEPTLHGDDRIGRGDRVFVNKWIYGLRYPFTKTRIWHGQDPQRWDIVVFKNPEPGAVHGTLVKRIVGLPGEEIQIRDGKIYANDQALQLPPSMPKVYYTSMGMYGVMGDRAHSIVPPGHYLVCGDNSGNSRDGRFFGWLPNGNILGRVACIWMPPTRWRDFTGFSDTWWWKTLLILVALYVLLRLFIGRSVRAQGSVDEAVTPGDHLLVNRAAFGVPLPFTGMRLSQGRAPMRGEIVVYRAPSGSDTEFLVGRVAGLPGEQVNLNEGRLTVNGVPVGENGNLQFGPTEGAAPYGRSKSKEYSLVPEGQYFIIAEDGSDGLDSRTLGWIPRKDVVGPAKAVWWPPTRWRRLVPW